MNKMMIDLNAIGTVHDMKTILSMLSRSPALPRLQWEADVDYIADRARRIHKTVLDLIAGEPDFAQVDAEAIASATGYSFVATMRTKLGTRERFAAKSPRKISDWYDMPTPGRPIIAISGVSNVTLATMETDEDFTIE